MSGALGGLVIAAKAPGASEPTDKVSDDGASKILDRS